MELQTRLLEQLAAPENLLLAWRAVRGNIPRYRRMRSAGPDGVSLEDFERDLTAQLATLQDMLLHSRYQPALPARFMLPKRGGGQRQVSILSVRDRVAQRAAQQVLEPILEPEFLDCSYGFRPGLSVEQAVSRVRQLRSMEFQWVVDGDIAACFENLDHEILLGRLQTKIKDRRVLHLLQIWLDMGVIQAGPPLDKDHNLAARAYSRTGQLQRSLDWVFDLFAEQNDPYRAARYESSYEPTYSLTGQPDGPYLPQGEGRELEGSVRRRALKRVLAGGLMWGATFSRPAMAMLRDTASKTLTTPVGRRLLKQGAYASGGLAGVAALAAVAALLLGRKAGSAPAGVLQGSPLSPLLANVYLHPFDLSMRRKNHELVRFADDWVVCCPNQEAAESAYNDAITALARLRLKINPQKTRLLAPSEPLEWLGMVVR